MATYDLDPDFRKDAPMDGTPFCVRCQKPIRDVGKAVHVTVNWETWEVVAGGAELMGRDCWKQITKKGPNG